MEDLVVITGRMGSWKDTAAAYIKDTLGIPVIGTSAVLRSYAQSNERNDLDAIARELASEEGRFAKLLVDAVDGKGVICGLRIPSELNYLQRNFATTTIGLTAHPIMRYIRIAKRAKDNDPATWTEFNVMDARDNDGIVHVDSCVKMADHRISNSYRRKYLACRLDQIMRK